ncbi:4-hydroxyphenylpyruvate dioxygenase family protein [Shumkonia mesophila]|uniref:4-hydroxyphenylpyruvate dioxygenase family protein n=1 Tax=Shumkonia mesophila TaxID=2838854 RepID=UPI002934D4A9|nr:VOC family protein [Shumkonia mesophila]
MSDAEPVDWRTAPNPHGLAGIEFLEFATFTDAEQEELKRVFGALGFAEASLHRSKKVTRFNQGDINFILNTEPDCFARSFATVHGVSVCAMALRVADAKKAHAFALKQGAQTYNDGTIGPGELRIPAIRGVYGSLIYYVDLFGKKGSIYDKDFRPAGGAAKPAAAGLTRIDHVSLTVLPGRTAKWVDFFKDLFGFHTWSHNVLRDPAGSVISNVVSSPDGTVHFPINESTDTGTDANRFVTEYFGEGIQHIALQTDDIFATVRAIEAAGLNLLPIPGRVYDEMAAAGKHPAAEVRALREHNILLDTEGGGRFRHAYTHPICNRFFFEIVERDGYTGFGRANASVRLEALREFYGARHRVGAPTE